MEVVPLPHGTGPGGGVYQDGRVGLGRTQALAVFLMCGPQSDAVRRDRTRPDEGCEVPCSSYHHVIPVQLDVAGRGRLDAVQCDQTCKLPAKSKSGRPTRLNAVGRRCLAGAAPARPRSARGSTHPDRRVARAGPRGIHKKTAGP